MSFFVEMSLSSSFYIFLGKLSVLSSSWQFDVVSLYWWGNSVHSHQMVKLVHPLPFSML